jgi:cytochrome c-type biogenesis protein CcmH
MNMRVLALMLLLATFPLSAQTGAAPDGRLQVPDAEQFVGSPKGQPVTGALLDSETHRIGSLLRCPVCQGMSVADSPSEMAVNMKHQVRELIARGFTEEQILKYFELSYGQFVLLKPKFEGVTGMVWVLPFIALILGGVVVFFTLKRLQAGPVTAASTPAVDAAQTTNVVPVEEDPYLARVREMVRGDKS